MPPKVQTTREQRKARGIARVTALTRGERLIIMEPKPKEK